MAELSFYHYYHSLFRHHTVNMPMLTTPEEGLILILLFMLVEIDRRETAAALDQQQQQQSGQTSSSRKSKKSSPDVGGFDRGSQNKRGRRKANITSFWSASCQLPTGSSSSSNSEYLLICSTRSWAKSHPHPDTEIELAWSSTSVSDPEDCRHLTRYTTLLPAKYHDFRHR